MNISVVLLVHVSRPSGNSTDSNGRPGPGKTLLVRSLRTRFAALCSNEAHLNDPVGQAALEERTGGNDVVTLAEFGTIQMEFAALSHHTGDGKFTALAEGMIERIDQFLPDVVSVDMHACQVYYALFVFYGTLKEDQRKLLVASVGALSLVALPTVLSTLQPLIETLVSRLHNLCV